MKKGFWAIIAIAALIACKDNPVSNKIRETRNNVSNTNKAVKEMDNMQEDVKKLQNETPLTNEELKAWLPESVNGMKRISYKAGQAGMMNVSSLEASYANEDKSKKFTISVIDGAGQVGSAATMAMRMLFSQDFEEETESGSRRTVTKKGVKAIEEYNKNGNHSTIQLMSENRFYLNAKGSNMDMDETWDAIDELDLNDLG